MNRNEILARIQKLPVRIPNLLEVYPVVFWVMVVVWFFVGFAVGKVLF